MTTAAEAIAIQTDAVLALMYTSCFGGIGSSLRDAAGNLRDFTPEEEAFAVALKAEYLARGLHRRVA